MYGVWLWVPLAHAGQLGWDELLLAVLALFTLLMLIGIGLLGRDPQQPAAAAKRSPAALRRARRAADAEGDASDEGGAQVSP